MKIESGKFYFSVDMPNTRLVCQGKASDIHYKLCDMYGEFYLIAPEKLRKWNNTSSSIAS